MCYSINGGCMSAIDYFLNGYSCSESIVLDSVDKGRGDASILPLASPFSGGISSGCLCGTVSGAMLIIGYLYGKNNVFGNPPLARELAKEFMTKFKEAHKVTCCRALTKGLEHSSIERKQHCVNFVEFSSGLLDNILSTAEKISENG